MVLHQKNSQPNNLFPQAHTKRKISQCNQPTKNYKKKKKIIKKIKKNKTKRKKPSTNQNLQKKHITDRQVRRKYYI